MKKSRVKIFENLNNHQAKQVKLGSPIYWLAVDCHGRDIFESTDLNAVIEFSNENKKIEYISKRTETRE